MSLRLLIEKMKTLKRVASSNFLRNGKYKKTRNLQKQKKAGRLKYTCHEIYQHPNSRTLHCTWQDKPSEINDIFLGYYRLLE